MIAVPSISIVSDNENQTVYRNSPIAPIVYTASNATGINYHGLPPSVSTSVTSNNTTRSIYGTPTSAGTFTYSVWPFHTNGCVSSTTLTGTIKVITSSCDIALPANPTVIPSLPRCGPGTVTLSAVASEGVLIDWYDGLYGGEVLWTGNAYTTSLTATKTYYARARTVVDNCLSASRTPATATVNRVPSVTLFAAGGSNNQTVCRDSPINTIIYLSDDANVVISLSSTSTLPPGVSSSVTSNTRKIYGTPTSVGTFAYSVFASITTSGCVSAASTGTITVVTPPPSDVASTQTWVYGGLTWSDRVVGPSACNKASFSESTVTPQCRSYNDSGALRYYYNWPYVIANQSTMCSSPWRVPTQSDFDTLVSATDGSTLTSASWGYGRTNFQGFSYGALYWSSTEYL
jgi:hypothetical protein